MLHGAKATGASSYFASRPKEVHRYRPFEALQAQACAVSINLAKSAGACRKNAQEALSLTFPYQTDPEMSKTPWSTGVYALLPGLYALFLGIYALRFVQISRLISQNSYLANSQHLKLSISSHNSFRTCIFEGRYDLSIHWYGAGTRQAANNKKTWAKEGKPSECRTPDARIKTQLRRQKMPCQTKKRPPSTNYAPLPRITPSEPRGQKF